MDVGVITRDMWAGIIRLVMVLWTVVPLAIVFGGSLLLSAAIIPSLISSGELSPRAGRLRRPLYLLAFISGALLVAALVVIVRASGVIGEFWPRWWI